MKKITIFDTYACSENIGDEIIMESVILNLNQIFSKTFKFYIPTHEYIGRHCYGLLNKSDYVFIGGTNLLTSQMNKYNQWKINYKDYFRLNRVLMMGVGWWQYQKKANLYTRELYKKVLHPDLFHSVRDSYTEYQLKKIGINNVINTGCPTMWNLTKDVCSKIPKYKGQNAIFTLTDYKPDHKADSKLFHILKRNYNKLYFWAQGSRDYEYSKKLFDHDDVIILSSDLNSLDHTLKTDHSIDYIGTRLHAGIRALQHFKRTIIIGVDNRAKEKAKDFSLPVFMRDKLERLDSHINNDLSIDIKIPIENIALWKKQFK